MRVEDYDRSVGRLFGDLDIGAVFLCNGSAYMKIIAVSAGNTVRLVLGHVDNFSLNTDVIECKGAVLLLGGRDK